MRSEPDARGPGADSGAGPQALRLHEAAALRLISGTVSPNAVRTAREQAASGAPDAAVLAPLVEEPVDERLLRERASRALREQLAPRAAAGRRRSGSVGKRWLAVVLVRGAFYLVMLVLVLAILILLREHDPELDIYAQFDRLRSLVLERW